MKALLLLCFIYSVSGHGGILYPPIWQDGDHLSIEDVYSGADIMGHPVIHDPKTGKKIQGVSKWLTDQAYLGGHGTEEFRGGPGVVTNFESGGCDKKCQANKVPWASPGIAPAFGGGCGLFGGNPYGCHQEEVDPETGETITISSTHNDTRPPGSPCLGGGTFMGGSDAREIEFPQAATTGWLKGATEEVAWASKAWHHGGYTYRLCKLPKEGRLGLTEECFQQNILSFATNHTMVRLAGKENIGHWEKYKQKDVREGTHPEGSVWRPTGMYVKGQSYIRKDTIVVPSDLPAGDYVLSFRWDIATKDGQVWLSCANVRLVD